MTAMVLEDTHWSEDALEVVERLAEAGKPFDAYDVSEAGLRQPPHPSMWGALFSKAQTLGVIAHCGWHKSLRRSRNGGVCSLWVGKGAS